MSLAHFWKIVMISSQPSEQYGFTTLFLFLLFLNSDIGIVILYIVKYIRKAFSLPKKINFEVQNLTNIHVFRFAFSDLYCYHTDLQNARNAVSDNLIFKISRGGMPPDPPSEERLRRSLVRIIHWSHPPVKNPGYGPGWFPRQRLWSGTTCLKPVLNNLRGYREGRELPYKMPCLQEICTESNHIQKVKTWNSPQQYSKDRHDKPVSQTFLMFAADEPNSKGDIN